MTIIGGERGRKGAPCASSMTCKFPGSLAWLGAKGEEVVFQQQLNPRANTTMTVYHCGFMIIIFPETRCSSSPIKAIKESDRTEVWYIRRGFCLLAFSHFFLSISTQQRALSLIPKSNCHVVWELAVFPLFQHESVKPALGLISNKDHKAIGSNNSQQKQAVTCQLMHCYWDFAGAVKCVDGLTGEWEVEIGRSIYPPGNWMRLLESSLFTVSPWKPLNKQLQHSWCLTSPHAIYQWTIRVRLRPSHDSCENHKIIRWSGFCRRVHSCSHTVRNTLFDVPVCVNALFPVLSLLLSFSPTPLCVLFWGCVCVCLICTCEC